MSACTRVTERATEGPCVYEGCGRYGMRGRHYLPTSHAFVGSVLARCGHPESEHRTEMFVGRMIDHAWCFTCHHITYHAEHRITRDAAHHAFAEFAG